MDYFSRPVQSDRNRNAFNGGHIDDTHLGNAGDQSPRVWIAVGITAALIFLKGIGVFG